MFGHSKSTASLETLIAQAAREKVAKDREYDKVGFLREDINELYDEVKEWATFKNMCCSDLFEFIEGNPNKRLREILHFVATIRMKKLEQLEIDRKRRALLDAAEGIQQLRVNDNEA